MEILINESTKLSHIQEEFNSHFPYLKLMFFHAGNGPEKRFAKENLISVTELFSEIRNHKGINIIYFDGRQKVSAFEKEFLENFGVYVQVFRKSGNIWLQSEGTDDWTLSEQNNRGKEMDQHVRLEKPDFDAYHEQL